MNGTESGNRNPRRSIVFAFALALACYFAWLARDVLVMLYVSGLFAVILAPVVHWVGALRVGKRQPFRHVAVLVLPVAVLGVLVAFCLLAVPPVLRDLNEFTKEMPSRAPALVDKINDVPFLHRFDYDDLYSAAQNYGSKAATYVLLSVKDWAGKLFDVVMGFVLMIYFILEGERAYQWFLSFFPPASRDRLDCTLRRAEVRMGKWLLGQGTLMLVLGLCSTIVYLSLHVRYAYALGMLTGLLNVIPVLGAAASIALALLAAALDSWGRVLGVAIFYAVYLQIENSLLVPRIMRNRVGLPGLGVLVALLLGSALAGIVGAMVSVPTAVLVSVLADEYLVNKSPA